MWIQTIAIAIAFAAVWLNNQVGSAIGTGGFVQQCHQLIRRSSNTMKRIARVLPWLAGISVILIIIGLRVDNPEMHTLLFAVFVFWGIISLILVHGLDIIATRFSFMKGLLKSVGLFSMLMFWAAFMGLTGALKQYGWEKSTEILLFLVAMNVSGIIVGSKTPWMRWLMEGTIWIVLLTSVIPLTSVPVFKATNRLVTGILGRTTVEVNNVGRAVTPDKLENLEPDTYYKTNRSGKFLNCDDCVSVATPKGGAPVYHVIPARVSPPAIDLRSGLWAAQVPEYPEVVHYNLRTYVVVYWAYDNALDNGFAVDKSKMGLVPPDALDRQVVSGSKSGVSEAADKMPLWGWGLIGLVGLVIALFVGAGIVRRNIRKANAIPAPGGSANPGVQAGGNASASGRGFPWVKVFGTIAAVAVVICLIVIAANSGGHAQVMISPPPPVVTAPAPTPAPTSNITTCTLGLPDFSMQEDPATGEFKGFVTAHLPWQQIPSITVNDGDTVEFWATGQMCSPAVGYVGPNGKDGPAGSSLTRSDEFPVGDAWAQALVSRIGPHKFQVGGHKTFVVPVGTGQQSIELMDNFRMPELGLATGGFQVTIKITRKV